MRDVMHGWMLSGWLGSSTTASISCPLAPCGSRIDSALSRTIGISSEVRDGRRGVGSSGFSTPAPMTFESRRRKLAHEAVNWSQRMNRRLFLNLSLTRA